MEKEDILKNLLAFSTAENELAIKEANHLIDVFTAIFSKEIEDYNANAENNESVELVDPNKDELNIKINAAIEDFQKKQKEKKDLKEKKRTKQHKH